MSGKLPLSPAPSPAGVGAAADTTAAPLPAASAAACCSSRTPAVKAITGRSIRPSSLRISRVAARPSITGI
ncbi:hypothetical protein [Thauera phenolivorans]|uniref:hypothetical protein n=1 Tax=Thauera phenolivorans TaxID=1792543 RepID=UPI00083A5E5B|nr:hypothetical protein [Thauera phenolivorans]